MTKKQRKNIEIDGAEYGVESRYSSKEERLSESKALMEARLQRMQSLTKDDLIKARLLQLKLRMEEFIGKEIGDKYNPMSSKDSFFTNFLKVYIDTIYNKRRDFAKDIGITPVLLSKLLNKHREPQKEFMLKLMVHSEKMYKNICNFPKPIWYLVYYHEQINETIFTQDKWRPKIEKQIYFPHL